MSRAGEARDAWVAWLVEHPAAYGLIWLFVISSFVVFGAEANVGAGLVVGAVFGGAMYLGWRFVVAPRLRPIIERRRATPR